MNAWDDGTTQDECDGGGGFCSEEYIKETCRDVVMDCAATRHRLGCCQQAGSLVRHLWYVGMRELATGRPRRSGGNIESWPLPADRRYIIITLSTPITTSHSAAFGAKLHYTDTAATDMLYNATNGQAHPPLSMFVVWKCYCYSDRVLQILYDIFKNISTCQDVGMWQIFVRWWWICNVM